MASHLALVKPPAPPTEADTLMASIGAVFALRRCAVYAALRSILSPGVTRPVSSAELAAATGWPRGPAGEKGYRPENCRVELRALGREGLVSLVSQGPNAPPLVALVVDPVVLQDTLDRLCRKAITMPDPPRAVKKPTAKKKPAAVAPRAAVPMDVLRLPIGELRMLTQLYANERLAYLGVLLCGATYTDAPTVEDLALEIGARPLVMGAAIRGLFVLGALGADKSGKRFSVKREPEDLARICAAIEERRRVTKAKPKGTAAKGAEE